MNRRQFLQLVAGLGVASAYPWVALAEAKDKAIDAGWDDVEQTPLLFEIINDYTLTIADYPEPKCRHDVYDVYERSLLFPKVLAQDLTDCHPLASHVGQYCSDMKEEALYALEAALDAMDLRPQESERRLSAEAARWPDHEDTGALADWVADLDEETFTPLASSVRNWLDDAPDWNWEPDYFSNSADGQSAALAFFRQQPSEILDALDIIIVEGEHPGSSYYAAELRIPVDDANDIAAEAGIPIRFKNE